VGNANRTSLEPCWNPLPLDMVTLFIIMIWFRFVSWVCLINRVPQTFLWLYNHCLHENSNFEVSLILRLTYITRIQLVVWGYKITGAPQVAQRILFTKARLCWRRAHSSKPRLGWMEHRQPKWYWYMVDHPFIKHNATNNPLNHHKPPIGACFWYTYIYIIKYIYI
jgi:hypothetical protein